MSSSYIRLTLATKDGRALLKQFSRLRSASIFETYYSPANEIEIVCSINEREEFERDANIQLKADCLSAVHFHKFASFLVSEADLRFDAIYNEKEEGKA